jgi:hypothetical protein
VQKAALAILPDVVSRRSRYHYGILVDFPIKDVYLEPEDVITENPEGVEVTSRMRWYISKVLIPHSPFVRNFLTHSIAG